MEWISPYTESISTLSLVTYALQVTYNTNYTANAYDTADKYYIMFILIKTNDKM